jgi:hypothetical protein
LPETSTDLRERARKPWRRRRLTLVLVTRRHSLSRSKGGSRGKSASRVHGSRARVSRDPRRSAPRACVRPAPHSRVLTLALRSEEGRGLAGDLHRPARAGTQAVEATTSHSPPRHSPSLALAFEARKDAVLPETSTDLRERARQPAVGRAPRVSTARALASRVTRGVPRPGPASVSLRTHACSLSRSKRGRTRSCRRPPQACASGHASRGGDDVSLSSSSLAVTRSRARSEEGRGLAGDLYRPARAGTQAVEATTSRSRPRHSPSLALALEARKDAVLPETSTGLRERARQPWRRRRLALVLVTRRHSLSRSKGGSRGKSASRVHGSRARVSRDPRRSAPRACVRPAPHARVLTLPLEARKDAVLPETSTGLRERARKPWRRRRLTLSSRVLTRGLGVDRTFEARMEPVEERLACPRLARSRLAAPEAFRAQTRGSP